MRAADRSRLLFWLLASAAVVRIVAYPLLRSTFGFEMTGVIHGSEAYDIYARNLIASATYGLDPGRSDAVLPPLYSVALAAVYRIAGRGGFQVAVLNTVCVLVAVAAIRRIGDRLLGPAIGTLAGVLTALYPYLIFQTFAVSDTWLFIALLYGFLSAIVGLRDASGPRQILGWSAAAGAALGFATLTRPFLPVVAVGAAAWMALHCGWRTAVARLTPVVTVAIIVLTPWLIRNARVTGGYLAIATNGGSNFWQGNNAETLGLLRAGYDVQWANAPPIAAGDRLGAAADAEFFRQGLDYLGHHPAEIPALVWTKLRVQWSLDVSPRRHPSGDAGPYADSRFERFGRAVHRLYWGPLFLLGAVGIVICAPRWREASLVLSVPAALTLVYVVTHPSTRYRSPGDPAWFLLAAATLVHVWNARARSMRTAVDDVVCWIGGGRYTQPLAPAMARKWAALEALGVPMHVVAFSADARPRRFTQHATFHLMPQAPLAPLRHLTMFALGPLILLRVARQHRTCVFIAQSPYEAAVGGVVKLWLRRCGGSAALIVETMGDFENAFFLYRRVPFQRPARWLMRRVATFGLRHADLGRAISAATERQLATAAPTLPIDRFPAWVDIEALRTISRSAPPSSSRDVLYVGALARIKGVHVLIDAFAAALPAATPARLVIVGPESNISYIRGLRTKVRALGIEARIVFAGERSSDEVAQLMSRARIVAVPSLSEGLSRVTLEAMAVGTPVVASRVGGIPDLVVDNETGWLVSPNDAGALADGLRRAFAGPAVDALGARARQRAYTLASADAYVAGHRRLLAAAQKIVRGERAG